MYCLNCGNLIDDTAKICPYCKFSVLEEGAEKKDEELITKIKANMNSRSDEELLKIWSENDRDEWRDEVFDIIENILIERGRKLPPQREIQEIIPPKEITEKPKYYGVKGWLLFFCISLTILSPTFTTIILIASYDVVSSAFRYYPALQGITILDIVLSVGIIIFGIVAGVNLWAKKPNGVGLAKAYLKIVLFYSIFGGLLVFFSGVQAEALFGPYLREVIGTVIYFSIWNSYLNKSKRVKATFKIEEISLLTEKDESEMSFLDLKEKDHET